MDKAVEDGIVQPGRYLILEFDFSLVRRPCTPHEAAESLAREINLGLLRFKSRYSKYLGDSFASETSDFRENDPGGNLRYLIEAVDHALENIRDEKDDPLPGVQGVCLFQTTAHHNAF